MRKFSARDLALSVVMSFIAFSVASSFPSQAGEIFPFQNSEKYPCDVFSYSFCFRKPEGTAVYIKNGPDFVVYELIGKDEKSLFSIYEGMAPSEKPGGASEIENFKNHDLRFNAYTYKNSSNDGLLELRFHYKTGQWLHFFGIDNADKRELLYEVLTTFRSCSKQGFTGVRCDKGAILPKESLLRIYNSQEVGKK